eukprot:scaffold271140_cov31-Tisochrysis_lutea.AAC.1
MSRGLNTAVPHGTELRTTEVCVHDDQHVNSDSCQQGMDGALMRRFGRTCRIRGLLSSPVRTDLMTSRVSSSRASSMTRLAA